MQWRGQVRVASRDGEGSGGMTSRARFNPKALPFIFRVPLLGGDSKVTLASCGQAQACCSAWLGEAALCCYRETALGGVSMMRKGIEICCEVKFIIM